jgi:hypothetical protein
MAIGALLLLAVSSASAQSLADVARSTRKQKAQQSPAKRQYDNDNMPKSDHLSVVGPAPAADPNAGNQATDPNGSDPSAQAAATPAPDPKAADAERQRVADEWKSKLDAQKQKIDSLNHELDLTQREYRLRAAAMYADAGNRLRNAASWDKEDADFKKQIDEKQKAVDAAKQELDNLQEQARKAGARQRE